MGPARPLPLILLVDVPTTAPPPTLGFGLAQAGPASSGARQRPPPVPPQSLSLRGTLLGGRKDQPGNRLVCGLEPGPLAGRAPGWGHWVHGPSRGGWEAAPGSRAGGVGREGPPGSWGRNAEPWASPQRNLHCGLTLCQSSVTSVAKPGLKQQKLPLPQPGAEVRGQGVQGRAQAQGASFPPLPDRGAPGDPWPGAASPPSLSPCS